MSNRRLRSWFPLLLTLIIAGLVVFALNVFGGASVTIKTGSLYPDASPDMVGCYTSGTTGELVTDPNWGVAIIESSGRRIAVTWTPGWTGRRSGSEVEVLDKSGKVQARTGTRVYLMGGYWYVDGSFLTCGPVRTQ